MVVSIDGRSCWWTSVLMDASIGGRQFNWARILHQTSCNTDRDIAVILLWCYLDITLISPCYYSDIFWYYSDTALILLWYCLDITLILPWYYFYTEDANRGNDKPTTGVRKISINIFKRIRIVSVLRQGFHLKIYNSYFKIHLSEPIEMEPSILKSLADTVTLY
jgi:hypothetical protein